MPKITAAMIAQLPTPEGGQRLVYDTALPGFAVRITKTRRTYVAESRVGGRTRRVTIGPVTSFTPDAARKEARKVLGLAATGVDVNAERAAERLRGITLGEAFEAFLEGRWHKPSTVRGYRSVMRTLDDWQGRELRHITPAAFVQRHDKVTAKHGAEMASHMARCFRATWNYARALTAAPDGSYTLPEPPTRRLSDLRKWHRPTRRQTYLRDSQVPGFFAALDTIRAERKHGALFADYCEWLLRAGLRKAEAASLLWEDVRMADGSFRIRSTKNGCDHWLPLCNQLHDILSRRLAARVDGQELVFVMPGASEGLADPRKNLGVLQAALGEPFGFHDLRRTFATLADRLDISGYAIKRLLNHARDDADVTSGYIVSDVTRLRGPLQRINDEIDRMAYPAAAPVFVSVQSIAQPAPTRSIAQTVPVQLIAQDAGHGGVETFSPQSE